MIITDLDIMRLKDAVTELLITEQPLHVLWVVFGAREDAVAEARRCGVVAKVQIPMEVTSV